MGVMHFQVHPPDLLKERPEVERAYISGADGRVFPTRVEVAGNIVSLRRPHSESGRVNIAWPVPGFGRPVVTTSSLPERDEPYLLPLELARGKLSQVRDQAGAWEIAGMHIPDEFYPLSRAAHRLFGKAAAIQHVPDQASALAVEALAKAMQAGDLLSRAYTRQRLSVRRRRPQQSPALLGCCLGELLPQGELESSFCDTFGAAVVPIRWRNVEPTEGKYHWELYDRQVQWCQDRRLLIHAGPLLDFSPDGMPDWLRKWERDFFNLLSFISDFVETAISRYVGRIRHWEIAARMNTGGALSLNEECRLGLAARVWDVARQVDDETQLHLRIAQPWGDYQARGEHRLSPFQFVDALLRSGVGLDALNLEVAIGFQRQGSASRDLLDFSRMIDQWSCLGLPLYVLLAFPSDSGPDDRAACQLAADGPPWKSGWTPAAQAEWIETYLPLLMAKQSVVGVHWTHFSDACPHDFAHAGLIDAAGRPKLALDVLARCSRACNCSLGDSSVISL